MKTSHTTTETSAEISVTLDKQDLAKARTKALTKLSTGIKIPGFRKGKVPANLVEQHVDPNTLASETLDIAVRTNLQKAYEQEGIQPISVPAVTVEKYVPGELAQYKVKSDIMPEVKLGNYKKLKSKPEKPTTKPEDIEDVLTRIAESMAQPEVVKRKAKLTDEVIIDFTGKKDDIAFQGGSAKDFKIVLGSNQFIPGFEEGIVGHESGDKFNLDLTFPKDYHNQDLAGAKTTFEVLLKQVNARKIPKIDDELAKKSGAFETLKDLKADIKKNLQSQSARRLEEKHQDALVQELVSSSKVEAPETLVADQIKFIRQDFERNLASRGLNFDKYLQEAKRSEEDWLDEAKTVATERVKASLILQTLAKELKIEIPDSEVDQKIRELKTVYAKDQNAVSQLDDPRVQADIKNRLRIEKTLEALVKANA